MYPVLTALFSNAKTKKLLKNLGQLSNVNVDIYSGLIVFVKLDFSCCKRFALP